MGEIYQSAKRVLIWLGDIDRCASPMFTRMIRVWQKDPTALLLSDLSRPKMKNSIWTNFHLLLHKKQAAKALQDIFGIISNSEWFARIWTVQEIAFAKKQSFWLAPKSLSGIISAI
jgi:hypothetical protein